jgi:hypothetical protein
MIKLIEAKIQCSLLPDENEFDRWFSQTIPALKPTIENVINRTIFADQAALDTHLATLDAIELPLNKSIVITESIKLAMKMLLGHWFNNREASSTMTIKDVPMSVDYLIDPYKLHNL